MRKYFKANLEPILVGFTIAILLIYFTNTVSDIIMKIAILNEK